MQKCTIQKRDYGPAVITISDHCVVRSRLMSDIHLMIMMIRTLIVQRHSQPFIRECLLSLSQINETGLYQGAGLIFVMLNVSNIFLVFNNC